MATITHKMTLSTTDLNLIGDIKVRQADDETQVFDATILEHGLVKSFEGLKPFFCLMAREVTGQGVSEEPVDEFDAIKGRLKYTLSANSMQMVGRNEAYFSFRRESSSGRWVEQFSTKSFHYTVERSIYTQPFKDSNYWFTFNELYRKFVEYQEEGKASWEDFVNQNKEIIESIDPGGKVLTMLGTFSEFRKWDQNIIEKVKNEFFERGGINIFEFGAKGDFIADDSDAFIDATSNYLKVYVPEGKYKITKNGVDYSVLYGPGRVFRNGKEVYINPDFQRGQDLLYEKHRMFSKKTWGTYENAAVMSIIANEDDPRSQTLGLASSKHAAQYKDRDSVGFYNSNKGRNPSYILGGETQFTSNTVTVPSEVANNFREDMVLDTTGTNRYTAIVESVDYESGIVTVQDRWYKVGDVNDTSIPINGDGIEANKVTKIWAMNNNIFFPASAETNSGVIAEWGIFNNKDFLDKGAVDLVNYRGKSGWGFRQRKSSDADDGFEYGTMIYDTVHAHTIHSSTAAQAGAKYLLSSFIGSDFNDAGFFIDGQGRPSKIKLRTQLVSAQDENMYTSLNTNLYILNKTTAGGSYTLKSPVSRTGELMIVKNASAQKIILKTEDAKAFVIRNTNSATAELLGRETAFMFSDGNSWHVISGNFTGAYPSPTKTGTSAPTESADFVGQLHINTNTKAVRMAVTVGQAQNDWVVLSTGA